MKIIISLFLVNLVILSSGCIRGIMNDYEAGIVEHNNSLHEALENCKEKCEHEWPTLNKTDQIIPKLSACNEHQCQCWC